MNLHTFNGCDFECDCDTPWLTKMLVFFSTIQIGFFLAGAVISNIIPKSDDLNDNNPVQPISYDELYPIEKATQEPDIILSKHSYVIESTPVGIVIMRYDEDDEGFLYWTNNAITYKMLDVVARKYVTQFCCKDVFIDRMKILNDKKQLIEDEINREKEKELMEVEDRDNDENKDDISNTAETTGESDKLEESEDGIEIEECTNVFANFKSYNNIQNETSIKNENITNKTIIADKSNKFIKKGSINDFDFNATSKKEIIPENQKIDFNTFKNLFWSASENKKTD